MAKQEKKDIVMVFDADKTIIEGYQQFPLLRAKLKKLQAAYPERGMTKHNLRPYFPDPNLGDPGVTYLTEMIRDARPGMPFAGLKKADLRRYGAKAEAAPGLREGLLKLKSEFSDVANIHYVVISVGLKDMLDGFVRANGLDDIVDAVFASEFTSDRKGIIDGVHVAVIPYAKTEWIIKYMKGSPDLLNVPMHHAQYEHDYRNMIVVGDGFTDISKFAFAKKKGGVPGAVYTKGSAKEFADAEKLLLKWVDYIMPRDYSVDGITFNILAKTILNKVEGGCKTGFRASSLYDYMKGSIVDPTEIECVENHLASCHSCQGFYDKTLVHPDGKIQIQQNRFMMIGSMSGRIR